MMMFSFRVSLLQDVARLVSKFLIVSGIVDDRSISNVDELALRHDINKRTLQRLFSNCAAPISNGSSTAIVYMKRRGSLRMVALPAGRLWRWTLATLTSRISFVILKTLAGHTPAQVTRLVFPGKID